MMRYISEKQVNLSTGYRYKKQYITSKQINSSRLPSQTPQQEIINSSAALKSLKKINDYKQMIKGRVSVLQIHEQKSDFRTFLNQQKYQFHQHMKQQMDKQRQEKAEYHKYILQKLNQAKTKATSHRRTHQSNLKKAKEDIYNSNKIDYITKKQKSVQIQQNIHKFVQQIQDMKKSRYLMVKQDEKIISSNIQDYKKMKQIEIKSKDLEQVEKVNRIKQERKKQIEQLAQLQTYMIEKQARSKMTSEESQRKLKLLLKGNKSVSTSHTTKLPPINPEDKKQHTDPDIFVV